MVDAPKLSASPSGEDLMTFEECLFGQLDRRSPSPAVCSRLIQIFECVCIYCHFFSNIAAVTAWPKYNHVCPCYLFVSTFS
jgi:hypothetical protein